MNDTLRILLANENIVKMITILPPPTPPPGKIMSQVLIFDIT